METDILDSRLELLVAVLLLVGVGNASLIAVDLVDYSYDIDYSEGFFIEDVKRLAGPGVLYPEPTLENGFESVKYPPVFYLVFGAVAEVFGYSFLTGRLINLASTAAAASMIYFITREKTGTELLLLPLMFLVPYLTIFSGLTIRTDMAALAFSLAGIYMVMRERLYHGLPFFVLSALTKQIFISGFLASALYLALERDVLENLPEVRSIDELKKEYYRNTDFWNFTCVYTLAGFTSLALLQLVYPHFLENVFAANVGGFDVRFDLLNWFHLTFIPVFGLASYYVYVFRDRLLGSYLAFSTFFMLLQMTRGGAWIHSAVQPFAAAVICSSVLYERVKDTSVRLPVSLLALIQLLVFFQAPFVSGSVFEVDKMDDHNRVGDERILEEVKTRENVYTEHAGYLVASEEKAPVEIWGLYERYASSEINSTEVEAFFKSRNYSSIVTYKRLGRLPIQDYLQQNYQQVGETERSDMLLNREEWRFYRWTG